MVGNLNQDIDDEEGLDEILDEASHTLKDAFNAPPAAVIKPIESKNGPAATEEHILSELCNDISQMMQTAATPNRHNPQKDNEEFIAKVLQMQTQLNTDNQSNSNEDKLLDDLLRAFSGNEPLETAADETAFDAAVDGLVQRLLSKDILHAPLADLAVRYEPWLQCNTSHAEFARFKRQATIVRQIVAAFERADYDADRDAAQLTALVGELQELGPPPDALLVSD